MTNLAIQPIPPAQSTVIPPPPGTQLTPAVTIPLGTARAKLMAKDPRRAMKAIERGFDKWWDEFWFRQETMAKAMGWRPQPDRMKRLAAYLQKPQAAWDEQQVKYPSDWQEDYTDFQNLRAAAARGEFSDRA